MCLTKIKDILFPLNIFGKKKRCFTFQPVVSGNGSFPQSIEWTGERIQVSWLYVNTNKATRHTEYEPNKVVFENGDYVEETVMIDNINTIGQYKKTEDGVHINCTNVTHLVVNDIQLI